MKDEKVVTIIDADTSNLFRMTPQEFYDAISEANFRLGHGHCVTMEELYCDFLGVKPDVSIPRYFWPPWGFIMVTYVYVDDDTYTISFDGCILMGEDTKDSTLVPNY